jgi:hypothetical protein
LPVTGELPTHALLTATHPAKAGFAGTAEGIQILTWGAHGSLNDNDPAYPLYERKEESERLLAIAREFAASIADLLAAAP